MRTEAIKGMYKVGETYYRKRKAFLLFPKTIDNEKRWLEVAEWEEVWHGIPAEGGQYSYWDAIKWLN
jgi:hypothetical protein